MFVCECVGGLDMTFSRTMLLIQYCGIQCTFSGGIFFIIHADRAVDDPLSLKDAAQK